MRALNGLVAALVIGAGALLALPASAEEGVFRTGADPDYRPISFVDQSGKLTGFDFDFATVLAQHMGVKLDYQTMAWDGIMPSLQGKKIDAITNIVVTDERAKVVAFSDPILVQTITTVVRADKPDFNPTAKDLANVKVGVMINTAAATALEKLPGVTATTYNTVTDEYNDLMLGRIDVVAIESLNGGYTVAATYPGKLRMTGTEVTEEKKLNAVALRKDDAALLEAVNKGIAAMKADGSLGKIATKWFGNTDFVAK